jgi:hypothetical protein
MRKEGSVDEALPRPERMDRYFLQDPLEALAAPGPQIVVSSNENETRTLERNPDWSLHRAINRFGVWVFRGEKEETP